MIYRFSPFKGAKTIILLQGTWCFDAEGRQSLLFYCKKLRPSTFKDVKAIILLQETIFEVQGRQIKDVKAFTYLAVSI